MNIIIAIMAEVQGQRGEQGRAVVYATQAKVVLEQYPMFVHMIDAENSGNGWPRYLTIAYSRYENENEDDPED